MVILRHHYYKVISDGILYVVRGEDKGGILMTQEVFNLTPTPMKIEMNFAALCPIIALIWVENIAHGGNRGKLPNFCF